MLPLSKQFGFGQSNPTYLLTSSTSDRFVLRKKPPGKLLSRTAHQVEREHRIIHALGPTDVPVPTTYCLCEDAAILGTAFYIMSFLDGRIIEDPSFPLVSASHRHLMWESAIVTIARLHRIPPSTVSLATYGPPSNFYARQIKTFRSISTSQAQTLDTDSRQPVGPLPHFPELLAFFSAPSTAPADRATLIHGDYKIDNLVYHPSNPTVIGILDWEMSTIGHPLSDLSNLLMPYLTAGPSAPRPTPAFSPAAMPGLPSRAHLLDLYATESGYRPTDRETMWADAFAMFRLSVIMQGIAARYALRQASSAKAKENGELRAGFAERAWDIVERIKAEAAVADRKARL